MASLSTILSRVRYKARDTQGIELTDALALAFVNSILEAIHQHLVNTESNLVYGSTTVTLAEDQAEYDLGVDHDGLLRQGVWVDDETVPLEYINETDIVARGWEPTDTASSPEQCYLNTSGQIGFYPIPDSDADGETVNVLYWAQVTQLTDTSDTLPWYGIWDRVIEHWLLFDFMERRESDNTRIAALLDQHWRQAMNAVYERGIRHWTGSRPMFDAEGV